MSMTFFVSFLRAHRADAIAAAVLVTSVTIAWCAANGKTSWTDFANPTAYTEDAEKSDVLYFYAMTKAASQGHFPPLAWKTVPELGAPYEANWNDWPFMEELPMWCVGVAARVGGIFAALNAAFIVGHGLAVLAMFFVCRAASCTIIASGLAALCFGVSPYLFAQSPHHLTQQYVWHVPLFLLVWRWMALPDGMPPGSRRLSLACIVGVLAGLQSVYFTNIFCQLTLLGAGILAWQKRSWQPLTPAVIVVAAAAATFALMNVDTWTFQAVNGPNPGALVREYRWLEIYGLKIKDLFVPPVTHRWDAFADFAKAHRQVAPLLDEGASYQGVVGIACLLWLGGTAVRHMISGREKDVPMEAWQVLWIVLMFTTGGLNAIVGVLGFTMFRGGCRYSVVILAITLFWAARRLSAMQVDAGRRRPAGATDWRWPAAALVMSLLVLWDQVPRPPTAEETATIARQVAADRAFTEKMEAALPDGAMVFQMPVMEFPESPAPGVPPYDHFRPYLYSRNLRYSFGSMKGRERENWQPAVQAKFFEAAALDQQAGLIRVNQANARTAVDELRRLGFSAVYVNRNGFPDRGKGIEEVLLELGCTKPPIRNATGDLTCIMLP